MSGNICDNCGKDVKIAIFKGSGRCSVLCEKALERSLLNIGSIPSDGIIVNSSTPIVVYEVNDDLNNVLRICQEEHGELESEDSEPYVAFAHHDLNRFCLRIKNLDYWIYDPEWEKAHKPHEEH